MEQGQVPLLLKQATITAIHKGDSRSEHKHYRPISLTSHLTIMPHSTTRKLRHIVLNLVEGQHCDVVYLDFVKAFDKVDHVIPCHKLKQIGICRKVGT